MKITAWWIGRNCSAVCINAESAPTLYTCFNVCIFPIIPSSKSTGCIKFFMWAFLLGFKDTRLTQQAKLQTVLSQRSVVLLELSSWPFDVYNSSYHNLFHTEESSTIKMIFWKGTWYLDWVATLLPHQYYYKPLLSSQSLKATCKDPFNTQIYPIALLISKNFLSYSLMCGGPKTIILK